MRGTAENTRLDELEGAVATLRAIVGELEPGCLPADAAVRLVEVFSEVERLGAAGRTTVARRIEESNCWRAAGYRSAAHLLAAKSRSSLRAAVGTLETARGLDRCAATAEAFRAGHLSPVEAGEIVSTAAERPQAEAELLATAATESVAALRNRCRQVRASGADEVEAYGKGSPQPLPPALDRARRRRPARRPASGGRGGAGAGRRRRPSPADLCRGPGRRSTGVIGCLRGRRLVALAAARATPAAAASAPAAMVHVRVDHAALVRGHAEAGEVCEIPGWGRFPWPPPAAWPTTASSRRS